MTVSPATQPFMLHAWNQAARSAGLDASRVHLLPVSGAAVAGSNKAACYPPYIELIDEATDLLHGAMLAEANLPEHREKHRVAIYEEVDVDDPLALAIMAATLRHELRHAEQREACGGELFALDELADQIVSWKVGGLPKSAVLYHLKPLEVDADAASAQFLRQHYAGHVPAILEGEDAPLARSNTLPGALRDLPIKTVAFMFGFCEVVEDPARSPGGLDFRSRLRLIHPRWAELWDAMAAARQA